MRSTLYLALNKKGSARVSKKSPALKSGEVCMKVVVEIPDQVFQKPQFEVKLAVDPTQVSSPTITPQIQDNIAEVLQKNLGVGVTFEIKTVDGLDEKLKIINSMGPNCKVFCNCADEAMARGANRDVVDDIEKNCKL